MMWPPQQAITVWLCRHPTDMRKSFNGLSALVKQSSGEDPLSGSLFVFVNRKQTQMRCLYFEQDGYCLWSKKLEQGQFRVDFSKQVCKQQIDMSTLRLIIEGIDTRSVRRFKRYRAPVTVAHVV